MEVQTSNELASTGYRCLFEGIKSEGIEPFLSLVKDIKDIYNREVLIFQTLFCENNDLDTLKQNHFEILKYLKEHRNNFIHFKFTNENVLSILESLEKDISPLDVYIENAKKLESLKIKDIQFESFWPFNKGNCGIYRNEEGKIINISKYYTDGEIVSDEDEILVDSLFHYSKIHFSIDNESFILMAQNNELLQQYRKIYIKNFEFDSTKLPSEEELQSYDIPQEFTRTRVKK